MKRQKTKKTSMRQEMVDPASLKAHPLNSSLFGRSNNYERLLESMRGGFLQQYPITCNDKDDIIMGHTRAQVAIQLGIKEVPVIRVSSKLSDSEVLRLMIEDNLCRPEECRQLSPLDKYVLSLRLEETRPEYRGGDKRSLNRSEQKAVVPKSEWLAKTVGLCPKYINDLRVCIGEICRTICETHPEIRDRKPYEQVAFILENGLSQDLADLHQGSLKISSLYKKYKKTKNKEENTPPKPRSIKEEDIRVNKEEKNQRTWIADTIAQYKSWAFTPEKIREWANTLTAEDTEILRSISKLIQVILELKKEQDIATMKDSTQMTIPGLES